MLVKTKKQKRTTPNSPDKIVLFFSFLLWRDRSYSYKYRGPRVFAPWKSSLHPIRRTINISTHILSFPIQLAMKVYKKNFGGRMIVILLIVMITATTLAAARPVDGEKPIIQIKRGPVPPSAPSACTDKSHTTHGAVGHCPNHR